MMMAGSKNRLEELFKVERAQEMVPNTKDCPSKQGGGGLAKKRGLGIDDENGSAESDDHEQQ
jgi:hypothetical protein